MFTQRSFQRATLILACAMVAPASAAVWYVDDDAPGGDGTSWTEAFRYLQDALLVADADDEIHVAAGTYRADERSDWPAGGSGDREVAFDVSAVARVAGGYAGIVSADPSERDPDVHVTVLSGDLNGDDTGEFENNADNSRRVLYVSGSDAAPVVEGVTISAAATFSADAADGGGVVCMDEAAPVFADCLITANYKLDLQGHDGAGVYIQSGTPHFEDCVIAGNGYCARGGGVYCGGTHARFTRCRIEDNAAARAGGGVYCEGESSFVECEILRNRTDEHGAAAVLEGHLEMTDCVIADNSVDGIGDVGALSMRDGKLVHCTITGNRSDEAWGGMSCEGDVEMWYCAITENVSSVGGGALRCKAGNVKLYNCIIAGNLGGYEYSTGGLLADEADLLIQNCTIADNPSRRWDSTVAGGLVFKSAQVRIANSVIWGNADEEQVLQIEAQNSTLTVAYSDVEGGRDAIAAEAGELIWSDGNIDADPLFVDSEDGDYHIQIGSPCVDAGNPDYTPHTDETQPDGLETDIDGQPRVWAGRIDMGADELFDCNGNGVDDDEDLAAGVLTDGDGDGVPDECAPSGTEDPNDATDPDDPNDALDDGMQPLPPIACGPGACGVGVVGWLPLTALGLAALRRTAGRPAARR